MSTFKLISATALLACVTVAPAANIPVVAGLNGPFAVPTVFSLNYSAANIFSTPLDGETFYRWNGVVGIYIKVDYYDGVGWMSDDSTINPILTPGEGIYYYALAAQTFVANLHGNLVPEIVSPSEPAPAAPPLVEGRYYFQGSPTGQSATYEDVFGAAPNNETAMFRFIQGRSDINPTGPDYRVYHYTAGVWTPETPVLDPLEAVFVVYPYVSLKYTVTGSPGTLNLTWPRGVLQAANRPGGPWETVDTGGNSHTVPPSAQTNQMQYYRVKE